MKKILITGGAGFIGSNFVHHWARQYPGDAVTVIDSLTYAGNRQNIESLLDEAPRGDCRPGVAFVKGDIADRNLVRQLFRVHDVDTVVHFAAESHVDRSIVGPAAFVQTNIVGTHTLLDAAREYWAERGTLEKCRFHHVSTDEVYGSLAGDDPAFEEVTPYDPRSPYSASKAASDHLVRAYHHTYGMNITVSNCSNNYGPYHYPEKLIPLVILNILHGREIPVYGDGMNVRDWLFVLDHCRAIELIVDRGRTGETYNIGGECELNNIDVVRRICAVMDELFDVDTALCRRYLHAPASQRRAADSLIKYVKDRPGHDRRYAMNITKIRNELGFAPAETFESGIRYTIKWYLDNQAWWEPLLNEEYRTWLNLQYG